MGTLKNQLAQYDEDHALLRQCTRRQVIYAKAELPLRERARGR